MEKSEILTVLNILAAMYPDANTQLSYKTPFQLLVAVILSAQCTDKRVNAVTKTLFEKYGAPEEMAAVSAQELEKLIYTCGFYRNKAKNIISASKTIMEKFGGSVPDNLEELQSLDGVGRKTANVVYSAAFGGDAIAVDTHVFRVSNRIGMAEGKDVLKTEYSLMENIPKNMWGRAHHLLIFHGRNICKAQRPLCGECKINAHCGYYRKIIKV